MKQKRSRVKPVWWLLLAILVAYLAAPVFLRGPGIGVDPLHRTIFTIRSEDVAVVLDARPVAGWSVELTGADREEAVAVLENLRYRYYYPDPAAVLASGSGWEQAICLQAGEHRARYQIGEDSIQVGFLIFRVDDRELAALFERHKPE